MTALEPLVIQAQNGQAYAFAELVNRFQDMAYATAYAKVGDPFLAEDVAQEAFIIAYQHLANLKEPAAFPGWFRTIVVRQCGRKTRRRKFASMPFEQALAVAAPEPGPVKMAEQRETKAFVHDMLRSLPEGERQVTTLFYIADYSQKEIAEFLGVQVSTVKSRLHRARNHLRERMIDMVQDTLQVQRPSRDEGFTERVMALIKAADLGKVEVVATLLEKNPELVDEKGIAPFSTRSLRPIHFACGYGHRAVVAQLLAGGAEINAKAGEDWAPLHYAVRGGHPHLAAYLIERGATVDIFAAAASGDLDRLTAFVDDDSAIVHLTGPDGATALHFAATVPVAQLLLDKDAAINALDVNGQSALTWTARFPDVARLLLSRGAKATDIFTACQVGDRPGVLAFLKADPALVHAGSKKDGSTPLHVAAAYGQVTVAKLLLERGAEVDARSEIGGATPLHQAASWGRAEMVRWLAGQGADLSARDTEHNSTPLDWAAFMREDETADLLIELGAEE